MHDKSISISSPTYLVSTVVEDESKLKVAADIERLGLGVETLKQMNNVTLEWCEYFMTTCETRLDEGGVVLQ